MDNKQTDNKRIAKNTLMLYIRMIFVMLVSLYTSRVVLATLGIEDYGIYNVVGGVVVMFGFLNGAMSASTSRYITFALGKGELGEQLKVFNTSLQIHLIIALLILLLAETVGLWFLQSKMIIAGDRQYAAFWVYQCSVLTMMASIINVPFNASIIAHERMSVFAYISIFEVISKLGIVYLLMIVPVDKLIFYAALLFAVQLLMQSVYMRYCVRHFEEVELKKIWSKPLFTEMLGFAGWNLMGNCAGILSTQGVNILLNMFFGPAVNAARGVAVQVQGAVSYFSSNFQMALNPQITKNYATGDLQAMHNLVLRSARFSFFLLFLLSLPIYLMTQEILEVWLTEVPDFSATFLQLSLMAVTIDSIANPLMVAAAATGNVRRYQTVVGGVMALNPQITKNYATGDLQAMHNLVLRSARFSFFLLFLLSLPIYLMTQEILEVWLTEVPDFSATFLQLSLMAVTIDSIANPLMVAAAATGNVRRYQTVVGGVIMLVTPIAYVVLKMGADAPSVFIVNLLVIILSFITRLYIIRSLIQLNINRFVCQVGRSVLLVLLLGIPIPVILRLLFPPTSIVHVVILGLSCMGSVCIAVYTVGLEENERIFVRGKIAERIRSFRRE